MSTRRPWAIGLLVAVILIAGGYAAYVPYRAHIAHEAWKAAIAAGTKSGYLRFLSHHPESPWAGEARARARDLRVAVEAVDDAVIGSDFGNLGPKLQGRRLAGVVLNVECQWDSVALACSPDSIVARRRDGTSTPLMVVFATRTQGVFRDVKGSLLCSDGGCDVKIGKAVPLWGCLGQTWQLVRREGFPVYVMSRGGSARIGLVFDGPPQALTGILVHGEWINLGTP
jgi:hypothetical protein